MKRLVLIFAVLGLWSFVASAQDVTPDEPMSEEAKAAASKEFSEKYRLLVSRLGADGVGIETVLNNWEKVDPENKELLLARYAYYMTKAQTTEVVQKSEKKYLGNEALLSLKDSLGNNVYYFQQTTYNDSLFAIALTWIDKTIGLYPKELYFRNVRCAALIMYEGESPDMALAYSTGMIDNYFSNPSGWEYDGEAADKDTFKDFVQEICYSFYSLGTPSAYRAFKSLSEKMLEYDENDTDFLANVGTYYLVAEKDSKTALKYYNKVLKINPNDYAAAKNCVLIYRDQKNTKMEKKYLPALIASTEDEAERRSAEARLNAL
ncbi:MAG: hypothetical protein LUD72_03550 [Bacteroidales bacterium]|nr:hypothetical protein [Bacteroidales bacterium]